MTKLENARGRRHVVTSCDGDVVDSVFYGPELYADRVVDMIMIMIVITHGERDAKRFNWVDEWLVESYRSACIIPTAVSRRNFLPSHVGFSMAVGPGTTRKPDSNTVRDWFRCLFLKSKNCILRLILKTVTRKKPHRIDCLIIDVYLLIRLSYRTRGPDVHHPPLVATAACWRRSSFRMDI